MSDHISPAAALVRALRDTTLAPGRRMFDNAARTQHGQRFGTHAPKDGTSTPPSGDGFNGGVQPITHE